MKKMLKSKMHDNGKVTKQVICIGISTTNELLIFQSASKMHTFSLSYSHINHNDVVILYENSLT